MQISADIFVVMRYLPPVNLPIRIVCATRLPADQFFSVTRTGQSLAAFRATAVAEVTLYASNSIGLSEVYNHAIESVRDTPRILVFIHDDCFVADYFWTQRVRDGLGKFDLVGVVGNVRRVAGQPSWIIVDPQTGRRDDYSNLSGAIGQGLVFPPERLDAFGPVGLACKLIDGVFFACYSETLHRTGLRFDPAFAFHFYDMDFCRSAERLELTIGTIPLSLVHASLGSLDLSWRAAYERYILKWQS
jgi:GT2 family glycosyltransferase